MPDGINPFLVGRTIKRYRAVMRARAAKWKPDALMPTELDRRAVAPFTVVLTHGGHARIRYHSSQVCPGRFYRAALFANARRIKRAPLMRLGGEAFRARYICFLKLFLGLCSLCTRDSTPRAPLSFPSSSQIRDLSSRNSSLKTNFFYLRHSPVTRFFNIRKTLIRFHNITMSRII